MSNVDSIVGESISAGGNINPTIEAELSVKFGKIGVHFVQKAEHLGTLRVVSSKWWRALRVKQRSLYQMCLQWEAHGF